MAITRDTVEAWYLNNRLTNKAQIEAIWSQIEAASEEPVIPAARLPIWTVEVSSSGLSADRIDLYVVIAKDEATAKSLTEREHRGDWHGYEITETVAFRMAPNGDRVLGRLVPEDER